MQEVIRRAKKCMSFTELQALKIILEATDYKTTQIVASKVSDKQSITRSVITGALCKAELIGFIESRSLGMKGTHIKVLEEEGLKQLLEEVSI